MGVLKCLLENAFHDECAQTLTFTKILWRRSLHVGKKLCGSFAQRWIKIAPEYVWKWKHRRKKIGESGSIAKGVCAALAQWRLINEWIFAASLVNERSVLPLTADNRRPRRSPFHSVTPPLSSPPSVVAAFLAVSFLSVFLAMCSLVISIVQPPTRTTFHTTRESICPWLLPSVEERLLISASNS